MLRYSSTVGQYTLTIDHRPLANVLTWVRFGGVRKFVFVEGGGGGGFVFEY